MSGKFFKIKIGDIWIIVTILVIALALFCSFRAGGNIAVVTQNGKEIYRFDLNDPSLSGKTYTVTGKFTNVIKIENQTILVSSADCPDRICVHSAPLGTHGGSICCAPNALVIRLTRENSEWDVISQ